MSELGVAPEGGRWQAGPPLTPADKQQLGRAIRTLQAAGGPWGASKPASGKGRPARKGGKR